MPITVGSDTYMVSNKVGSFITVALDDGGRYIFRPKKRESIAAM